MAELFAAANQWAQRPQDERFWTLEEAMNATRGHAESASEQVIDFRNTTVIESVNRNITLALPDASKATLTNWSAKQLGGFLQAPIDYLATLPTELAVRCLNDGLDKRFGDNSESIDRHVLIHGDGETGQACRAFTSPRYTRVWNHDLFSRLIDLQDQGWKVPPARPTGKHDPRSRLATADDVLESSKGFDLGIQVGDPIAPAGIYASDHDMFAFMVNEDKSIDNNGKDGGLSRGFFLRNSEVGASSLWLQMFHYRNVCGNHIVWGVESAIEVKLRHVGKTGDKFRIAVEQIIKEGKKSAKHDRELVARAKDYILGQDDDSVVEGVIKALIGKRSHNLQSGMSLKVVRESLATAKQFEDVDGNPYSVWGFVNGMTRLSQTLGNGYADKRMQLDRFAGQVLALVA